MRGGLRLVREIGNQPALAQFNAGEVLPGPGSPSDEEIDAHIRATGSPFTIRSAPAR